jgi:hypothetical protein
VLACLDKAGSWPLDIFCLVQYADKHVLSPYPREPVSLSIGIGLFQRPKPSQELSQLIPETRLSRKAGLFLLSTSFRVLFILGYPLICGVSRASHCRCSWMEMKRKQLEQVEPVNSPHFVQQPTRLPTCDHIKVFLSQSTRCIFFEHQVQFPPTILKRQLGFRQTCLVLTIRADAMHELLFLAIALNSKAAVCLSTATD